MRSTILVIGLLLLTACQLSLDQRVEAVPGEILYNDVLFDLVPADEIVFFGIKLGDSEEQILDLHGEPNTESEFKFGRLVNLEYNFSESDTTVLYHINNGEVTGILVTKDANDLLIENTKLGHSLPDIFGLLGTPTKVKHLHLEQVYYFDELGYEVFTKRKKTDRIYFTIPNRGIETPGELVNQSSFGECPKIPTYGYAEETDVCILFPDPCKVAVGFEIVPSCDDVKSARPIETENKPPIISVS